MVAFGRFWIDDFRSVVRDESQEQSSILELTDEEITAGESSLQVTQTMRIIRPQRFVMASLNV